MFESVLSLDTMWTILCEFISLLQWKSASGKLLLLNQNILHVVILTSKTGGWAGKTRPKFEVLTAVSMKVDFVWDVTPCILVHTYRLFPKFWYLAYIPWHTATHAVTMYDCLWCMDNFKLESNGLPLALQHFVQVSFKCSEILGRKLTCKFLSLHRQCI